MTENPKIWLSTPHMGGTEIQYINEAIEGNWVAPLGPNVDAFEQSIVDYVQIPHCAALSSGTAAIHLALIALGVSSGDEVLCSSFTFSATCNPIVYLHAHPIFIDSETDTWNMCPEALEAAIIDRLKKGKKPKAILIVHLYGMPAKMDPIIALAQQYEIPIIEDAAEGLGASYQGKALGTLGTIGVFSFNGNKIITTSGGGALVSRQKEYIIHAKKLATQAREEAPHYQHEEIGYNYRMSNICAGIGRGQMEVIDLRVRQRRANFEFYQRELSQYVFQEEQDGMFSNRWLSCILLENYSERENLRLKLEKENIESRPLWKPMHLQPIFKDCVYYGNQTAETLFEKGLCLPSGSNLTEDDLNRIINAIAAF